LYGRPARSQADSETELAPIGRVGLHAYALALFHPLNGQALHFQAPYPADFAQAVERLRQSMR
jgi:23S rRNA pseudouridine1911/1915/1917 synthase